MIPAVLTAIGLFFTLIGAVVAGLWGAPFPGTMVVASGYPDFARKQRRMA
jgi:hypothetical protein